jgi:IPT/TIG domain
MRALPIASASNAAHSYAANSPAIAATPLTLATFEGGGEQTAISAPGNGNFAVTTPADPSFAAGASDVVEAVNSAVFVYSRAGAQLASFGINGMIGNLSSSGYVVQYPHVVYDPASGVFILTVLQSKISTCSSQIVVMDSQTNPALPWQARGSITLDPELPPGDVLANLSMALTGTLVVATSDYRACSGGVLGAFVASQTVLVQRADLVAGKATSRSASFLAGGPIGVQPVMGLALTTVAYEIVNDATCTHVSSGSFAIFSVTGTPDAGNVSQTCTPETQTETATISPPPAPQSGTSATLTTNDDRFLNAMWTPVGAGVGVLWAVGTTGCTPGGDSTLRSCLNVISMSASTTGVVAAPNQLAAKGVTGSYLYDPSIAVDSSNTPFVTFDESSASTFESMQLATIASGTWSAFTTIRTSGSFYSPGGCAACTWGDYSAAVQDPLHPTDVWVVSSDVDGVTSLNCATVNSCWNTWVARYTFAAPSVNSLTPSSGTGSGGQLVTVSGSDFATPAPETTATFGGSPIAISNLTADSFTFTTPPQPAVPNPVHIVATDALGSSSATSAGSGFLYVPLSNYTPLPPFRVLDTRGPPMTPIGAGPKATRVLQITGVGTTPVPAGAVAAVINVTEVNGTANSLLTVFPTGTPQPTASNLNFNANTVTPNLVTVALSGSGQVSIFNSVGSVNVVVDVEGYFAPPSGATSAGEFHPILPERVCDTRSTSPTPACKAHGVLVASAPMLVTVTGTGAGAIPSSGTAEAAVLNLTAITGTLNTFVTVYPTSTSGTCPLPPTASTINVVAGAVEANRVFVKLGPGPSGANTAVCVFLSNGRINVVLDANGWFGTASAISGFQYQAVVPTRICDTRKPPIGCAQGAIGAGSTVARLVHVAGEGGVPSITSGIVVQAVIANMTAVQPTQNTFLEAYPAGTPTNTSDLNLVAGATLPNLVVVQLSTTAGPNDGCFDILNSAGSVNAVIDVEGWFQ